MGQHGKGKKYSAAQKRARKKAKAERQKKYKWVFMHGKKVRIKIQRPPTIEGMDVDEFIRRNADPIWLHQNELWHLMDINNEEELELDAIDDPY